MPEPAPTGAGLADPEPAPGAEPAEPLDVAAPDPDVAVPDPAPDPDIAVREAEPEPAPEPDIAVPEPAPEPDIAVPEPEPEPAPDIAVPEAEPEPDIAVPEAEPEPEPAPEPFAPDPPDADATAPEPEPSSADKLALKPPAEPLVGVDGVSVSDGSAPGSDLQPTASNPHRTNEPRMRTGAYQPKKLRATILSNRRSRKGGPRHPLIPLPLLPSGPGGVHSCHVTRDHKSHHAVWFQAGCGGRGIRTLGTFQYTRFPIVHLRPLGHPSNGVYWELQAPRTWGAQHRVAVRRSIAEEEGFEPPLLAQI